METLWIIGEGTYSDYDEIAVVHTKEEAEAILEVLEKHKGRYDEFSIREVPVWTLSDVSEIPHLTKECVVHPKHGVLEELEHESVCVFPYREPKECDARILDVVGFMPKRIVEDVPHTSDAATQRTQAWCEERGIPWEDLRYPNRVKNVVVFGHDYERVRKVYGEKKAQVLHDVSLGR